MYNITIKGYKPVRYLPETLEDPCPVVGDVPVLQFINTVKNRNGINRKDYLKCYQDFLNLCHDAGLIGLDDYHVLDFEAHCYVAEAKQRFNTMINIREVLYDIVYCLFKGKDIHEASIGCLNRLISEANACRQLVITANGIEKAWINAEEEIARPLWLMALKAEELLQNNGLKNIRRCYCGNFYIDSTKNGKRRWCNPQICGNAARKKAYRERKKKMGDVRILDVPICE